MIADLTKMLQSAAKGKAPVVAIPVEGHAPLCLNRKRLAVWLKGVIVEGVEAYQRPSTESYSFERPKIDYETRRAHSYDVEPEGPENRIVHVTAYPRTLKIKGSAPGSGLTTVRVWDKKKLIYVDRVVKGTPSSAVRTSCTLFSIPRREAILTLHKWAEKEREKQSKIIHLGAISPAAFKEAQKTAKAAQRAAALQAIEAESAEVAELNDACRALASFKAQIARSIPGRKVWPLGINGRDGYTDRGRRQDWLEWHQNRRARGIEGKRQRERQGEMDAIHAELARITPPHRGKGSRRVMTAEQTAQVHILYNKRSAIHAAIRQGTNLGCATKFWSPAKKAREPESIYGKQPTRLELARELATILARLREAERMKAIFDAEEKVHSVDLAQAA